MAYGIWYRAIVGRDELRRGKVYKIKSDIALIYACLCSAGSRFYYTLLILRNNRLLLFGSVHIRDIKTLNKKEEFLAGIARAFFKISFSNARLEINLSLCFNSARRGSWEWLLRFSRPPIMNLYRHRDDSCAYRGRLFRIP